MTISVPYAGGYGISEVTLPGPFKTLAEMKAANKARRIAGLQGGEYWGRAESRFFDAKTCRTVIEGRFVIDSRQFHGSDGHTAPREYSVVMVSDDGEVVKVAFPPVDWDGKAKGNSGESGWTEHFSSPELAKIALRVFLARKEVAV